MATPKVTALLMVVVLESHLWDRTEELGLSPGGETDLIAKEAETDGRPSSSWVLFVKRVTEDR